MNRLIVISAENDYPREADMVNGLFDEGLSVFHLRKPAWSLTDQNKFLDKIRPDHRKMISIHQHYESANTFPLKYFHFREKDRSKFTQGDPALRYSTSYHDRKTAENEAHTWNHVLLSPLFAEISKNTDRIPLYGSLTPLDVNPGTKVFALGGIHTGNTEQVFALGFYGAAVLGSVWDNSGKEIRNFRKLNQLCNASVHTY